MRIFKNITDTIGHTPLLKLNRLTAGMAAEVCVKLEYFNPSSSIKDRAALNMIVDAEKHGKITRGGTLVEATSGNTGIGLAMIAAARGYTLKIVMPESMSIERRRLIAHFGAELVLTPAEEGMAGAVRKAQEIIAQTPNSLLVSQFDNPANPAAHITCTGKEILAETDGEIACFVAAVGTGGTLTGVARVLKPAISDVEIVAVEPADSAVLSGKPAGKHMIQGIGAGFIPQNYDPSLVDRILTVGNDEAVTMAKRLATEEGILCGISSGANVAAALRLAEEPKFAGKRIVTIICDTGERYLSTSLFD